MNGVYNEDGSCKRCGEKVSPDRLSPHNAVHSAMVRLKSLTGSSLTDAERQLLRNATA